MPVANTIGNPDDVAFQCEYTFLVAFDQVKGLAGQEVVPTLNEMAREIEGILMAIQAETVRLPNTFN